MGDTDPLMGSTDPFAALGDAYEASFRLPLRRHLEVPGVLGAVGDPAGLSVLDLGCGTGAYARLFRRLGAARVVGLDASDAMMTAAREIERAERSGIEYITGDLTSAGRLGTFDLVTAVHVLSYADSGDRLDAMWRAMHAAVAPGGRCVCLVLNPDFSTDPEHYTPYGLSLRCGPRPAEGSPVELRVHGMGAPFSVTVYYRGRAAWRRALLGAGFTAPAWHSPTPTDAGIREHGEKFWHRYVTRPHALLLTCRRGPGPTEGPPG
ncbi:class I SAM-dependent methyltransferase [Streptomyces sp. NPDC093252]|uniref:class I SAM-dependent methyltransferase n=1 Tax=Streptomyces sp. NPDC093252 TaxID=3154980 RepID=UPI00342FFAEC